jgi:hypothetical protein
MGSGSNDQGAVIRKEFFLAYFYIEFHVIKEYLKAYMQLVSL